VIFLPKEDREERAVERFLAYYNQANKTSYEIKEWLDRTPRVGQGQKGPIPDCLCVDAVSGTQMVIERTMLTGEQDLKLTQSTEKFLTDVRSQLDCKLPGVFLLYDWGVYAIRYRANDRQTKIDQLCQEILRVAPTLAEGEEVPLCQPFPVRLRKEEAWKVKTNCALTYVSPGGEYSMNKKQLDQQFQQVLSEANEKFRSYISIPTVLLTNICETGLNYEEFEAEVLKKVDMEVYPNIRHIYLSEGLPDPPIYHLWSSSP